MAGPTPQNRLSDRLQRFMQLGITVRIPVWITIPLVLLAYIAWETYWYRQIGYRFIKWHTHIAIPLYIWLAGLVFIKLLAGKNKSGRAGKAMLLFSAVMGAITISETTLTITGSAKNYFESQLGYYDTRYKPNHNQRYLVWPNNPHQITKPEFSYTRPTNTEGTGDSNWTQPAHNSPKRIMVLGDSFTEGDGAPYDSTYPALLKQKLLAGGDTVYMMNAGVCGSDPFYNYMHFKERLIKYQPGVVVQMIGSNDVKCDYLTRGGLERFTPGAVKYRKAPWWEPIYALSYTSRLLFTAAGYNELLLPDVVTPDQQKEVNRNFSNLFNDYAQLCSSNNIQLMVLLRPDESELKNGYDYNFSSILTSLQNNPQLKAIDLYQPYTQYIKAHHSTTGKYYWPLDHHHNATGYTMLADVIYPDVQRLINNPQR